MNLMATVGLGIAHSNSLPFSLRSKMTPFGTFTTTSFTFFLFYQTTPFGAFFFNNRNYKKPFFPFNLYFLSHFLFLLARPCSYSIKTCFLKPSKTLTASQPIGTSHVVVVALESLKPSHSFPFWPQGHTKPKPPKAWLSLLSSKLGFSLFLFLVSYGLMDAQSKVSGSFLGSFC